MSTAFCSVFSLNRTQLLVFGYLRENVRYLVIPIELRHICIKFYNEVTEWTLKGKDFNKLRDIKCDEKINGPRFELSNNLQFQLKLTPKYEYGNDKYTILWLAISDKNLSKLNIENVQLYFVLYCVEGAFEYKHITTLSGVAGQGQQSQHTRQNHQMWYTYSLKYAAMKNMSFEQINFGCFAQILRINYNQHENNQIKWFTNSLKIHSNYKYEWILNKNELKRFTQSEVDHSLYSKNFNNDSFCIVIAANGLSVYQHGNGLVFMKIKLLKLPAYIDQIEYKYHLKLIGYKSMMNSDSDGTLTSIQIEMNRFANGMFNYYTTGFNEKDTEMKFELLKDVNYIKIIAEMSINAVSDVNGKEIAKTDWSKYGFI